MKIYGSLTLAIYCLVFFSGCTSGAAKRTTYETFENIRIQPCGGTVFSDCSQREGYDSYRRKRDEVVR